MQQTLLLPPTDKSVIVSMLLDACFSRADAEAWADGSTWTAGSSIVAAEAIAYDDHGIPLDQAIAWHAQGSRPPKPSASTTAATPRNRR